MENAQEHTESKRYHRQKLNATIASLALTLAALALVAFWFGPMVGNAVAGSIGSHSWLELIIIAAVYVVGLELLTLPLGYYSGYVLEHRYQLSNQTFPRWVWRQIKGYLVGAPIGLALLLGLYVLIWFSGPWWWIWAAIAWLVVTVLMGQFLPVVILPLFYKVTRLDDVSLLDRLRGLAAGTGLNVEGIYRLHLSADTRKVNAALAGLGHTRRVLLGDTLLDSFTPGEIEVVFAHEVGHHVHRHMPKMIAGSVALAAAGFWLVDVVLRSVAAGLGYPRFDDPAALPLLLFVLSAFGLILSPVQCAISRFFERQCDRYALRRTNRPDAYRSAFTKLAKLNKADMNPNPITVWLFDDHPPIRERLALADEIRC